MGSYFPNQESNLCPLKWKLRVLTTGPLGKSLFKKWLNNIVSYWWTIRLLSWLVCCLICLTNTCWWSIALIFRQYKFCCMNHLTHAILHSTNASVVWIPRNSIANQGICNFNFYRYWQFFPGMWEWIMCPLQYCVQCFIVVWEHIYSFVDPIYLCKIT